MKNYINKKILPFILLSSSILYLNTSQAMQYPAYISQCTQEVQSYTFLQTTRCIAIDGGNWYGLYPGHDGNAVAAYLKDNLHNLFHQAQGTIQEKFDAAFKTASLFCKQHYPKCYGNTPGASASIVFIKDNIAHTAYVGSGHTIIMNDQQILFATNPHNSHNTKEKERITEHLPKDMKTGQLLTNPNNHFTPDGHFQLGDTFWRVTRSIGDDNGRHIICTPEYHEHTLTETDTCIFLATHSFMEKFNRRKAADTNIAMEIAHLHDSNDVKKFGNSYPHGWENQTIMIIDLKNKIINVPWWKNNIKLLVGSGICAVILGMIVKKYYK